ncbi:MAG: low temperature requirement protein A [Rubrivivax sp.]|nr:low temperature requirement protein A [Rubrivivax sp.]
MTAAGHPRARRSLLRPPGADHGRVGMAELFFDLVFVFAVTQFSHALLAHSSWAEALRLALLFVAVWMVWMYTVWFTNYADPERAPVRIALFVAMALGLLLSVSIPQAFGALGALFACAYVAMQLGRTSYFVFILRDEQPQLRRNNQRVAVWQAVAAVFWLIGGFAEPGARLGWWVLAFAIDFASPWCAYWVPGLGAARIGEWTVDGNHMAERCALFVIIALGESLLVTGATFARLEWTAAVRAVFASAFVGTVAMWWLYFDRGMVEAHHRIAHSSDPGRQARADYSYLHFFIVAAIIVCAAGDELAMAHPAHADGAAVAVMVGGPALYLLSVGGFKWLSRRRTRPPLSHLVGLGLLALLGWAGLRHAPSALALHAAATAVLLLCAVWEHLSLRGSTPAHAGAVTAARPR